MTSEPDRPDADGELRRRAEAIDQRNTVSFPEDIEVLSLEETRRRFHELRVHQIELEMQNTQLREAQLALEASQASYFQLYDLAPVGYCTVSDQGVILEANLNAAKLLWLVRGALVGQKLAQFIIPEDQDKYYQLHRGPVESSEPRACELRMVQGDGTAFWVHLSVTLRQNESGMPVTWMMLSDITKRKQAEAERELLITAIEQTEECIVITDTRGTIQYVNPVFEQITGYTRLEAIGQNPRILKSGQQDHTVYHDLWESISSGRRWQGRLVNQRKDGTQYTEEVSISPVLDSEGRVVNYVAVKRDITEHLRLSDQFQQAQKMESVALLAGGVAHDFNNMLGVILGYTEICQEDLGPESPLYANLQEIWNAATRSAILTRQLLTFARRQIVAPVVLDLNETVNSLLNMLRRLVGEGINFTWSPEPGLWPVKIDPSQIDQILTNLCINARDAIAGSSTGKIVIEVKNSIFDADYCSAQLNFAPGEYVKIAISDNGCGMDELTLSHIFEPFFTTKAAGEGTGLGLASVHGAVIQNKGFINVYSEPGMGTTFAIYLPRYVALPAQTWTENATESAGRGHETILLVEDDLSILTMAAIMLKNQGYKVLAANSPDEAVRLAVDFADKIHLLLTDVIMPGMNGQELAGRLLINHPEMKHIFMSGYPASIIASHGVLDEGVPFIQKPFTLKVLSTKIREVLD